jgi:hypothetical protein
MGYRPLLGIAAILLATAACATWLGRGREGPAATQVTDAPVDAEAMAQMQYSDMPIYPQSFDVEGVLNPELVSAEKAELRDDEIVIGVVAFGESRAYLRSAFDRRPERHIVNDKIGSVPVSLVHCDQTRRTRVLTSGKPDVAVEIRCGGWLASQEMALLVKDRVFGHTSQDLPFQDMPFVVTTWKKWLAAQPATKVYVGGQAAL